MLGLGFTGGGGVMVGLGFIGGGIVTKGGGTGASTNFPSFQTPCFKMEPFLP